MNFLGKDIEFPGITELSFDKLVMAMQEETQQARGARAIYLQELLHKVALRPELTEGVDPAALGPRDELVDELMQYIFPPALTDNEIKCAAPPWRFAPFYLSRRLQRLIEGASDDFRWEFVGMDPDQLYVSACSAILSMYYGYSIRGARPFYLEIQDKESGRKGYYRMAFNADFITVRPSDRARPISLEDYHRLMDNYHDIALWKSLFPPGSWVFSGFSLLNMMDTTMDQIIQQVEEDLVSGSQEGGQQLVRHMAQLLEVPDLQMAFVSIQGDRLLKMMSGWSDALMLGSALSVPYDELLCADFMHMLIEEGQPLGIPDMDRLARADRSPMCYNLHELGIKSYFVTPVMHEGQLIGLLELGSRIKGALDASSYILLEQVLPVLALAGKRNLQMRADQIEAIIQQDFTSIHPSVKWRFVAEAERKLQAKELGEHYDHEEPVFGNVHALYGQVDIRDSARLRHAALHADQSVQTSMALRMLELALRLEPSDELEARYRELSERAAQLTASGQPMREGAFKRWMGQQLEPALARLAADHRELHLLWQDYLHALDSQLGLRYHEQRKYDRSVEMLNALLAQTLVSAQHQAQERYPHYFQYQKTDGLSFDLYAGGSISPEHGYGAETLHWLRRWQLRTLVQMERSYREAREQLPLPLEVAAMLLAYQDTLAVHFRMDEKRFDVEGAYNARYEVIKSRLDKAQIKGSAERITRPGHLVVICTSAEIEEEYLGYMAELLSEGLLLGAVERHELAERPGVSELRALRVRVVSYGESNNANEHS